MGLGLDIVARIVQQAGGEVKVKSAGIGFGSTFTFSMCMPTVAVPWQIEAPDLEINDQSNLLVGSSKEESEYMAHNQSLAKNKKDID